MCAPVREGLRDGLISKPHQKEKTANDFPGPSHTPRFLGEKGTVARLKCFLLRKHMWESVKLCSVVFWYPHPLMKCFLPGENETEEKYPLEISA